MIGNTVSVSRWSGIPTTPSLSLPFIFSYFPHLLFGKSFLSSLRAAGSKSIFVGASIEKELQRSSDINAAVGRS
jgi:hypothetical protein